MFCHDFQNNRLGRSRNNCKFIHCDREMKIRTKTKRVKTRTKVSQMKTMRTRR